MPNTRCQASTNTAVVIDKVEQIIEPAIRIIASPLVQLGLDLQYPQPSRISVRPQLTDIHRRTPDIPRPHCGHAVPLRHVTGFPGLGDYYEDSVPSQDHQPTTSLPAAALDGWRGGKPGMVPTFTF